MMAVLTFASANTHIAMGLAVILYLWIAVGNYVSGNKWIAFVWASYALSNVFFIGDWLARRP